MANALYTSAKKNLLDAAVNFGTADIRALLIDTSLYTFSAAHDFLDDVAALSRIDAAVALTGLSTTGGVFDAGDVTFPAPTTVTAGAVILYVHTGTPGTSKLLMFIDTATGIPLTTSGADVTVRWSNGASKIYAV